ncbi:MAG: hypothetical protein JWP44_5126 [Mucilaginibacter sp.]|nr:hypothetical protein [Mucilaginibacter sp.]
MAERRYASSEEIEAAEKAAAEYQNSMARAQFEQETQRDKTLVLMSGGALTVSFAFISHTVVVAHCRLDCLGRGTGAHSRRLLPEHRQL